MEKQQRKDTRIHLVEELQKLPWSLPVQEMIDEALAGEYHDYKNNKYVCGKVEVSSKLRRAGFIELAKRVEAGEFDEEADEEDKAMMREMLPKAAHDLFKL